MKAFAPPHSIERSAVPPISREEAWPNGLETPVLSLSWAFPARPNNIPNSSPGGLVKSMNCSHVPAIRRSYRAQTAYSVSCADQTVLVRGGGGVPRLIGG